MTPEQAAAQLLRVADRLLLETKLAVAETTHFAYRQAVRYSSGPYSTAELRRKDHPYARRHGTPRLPPYQINRQTGTFLASWRSEGPLETGGSILGRVYNVDPVWERHLAPGTRYMFARPLTERVQAEADADLARRMARVLAAALRA